MQTNELQRNDIQILPEIAEQIEKTYQKVPHPYNVDDPDDACIEILKGPFRGVIVKYGPFKVSRPDENGDVDSTYEYDVVYVPDTMFENKFTDEQGKEFEYLLGQILIKLCVDETTDERVNEKEELRTSDTVVSES